MTDTFPVLFNEVVAGQGFRIGIATLNAEKALNALSVDMIQALDTQLRLWQTDTSIAAIWLQGAGEKAFCAGGDIRRLYESIRHRDDSGRIPYAEMFFGQEYRLDYLIHCYGKPLIVWGQGIVMGGGIGLLSGASHRVLTETSRLAMPEISIGLFPDVGGTWFLNHAPGRSGLFLGLTGAHINAADGLFTGLGDRFIQNQYKTDVINALQQADWDVDPAYNRRVVSHILRGFEAESREALPASKIREHYDLIQMLTDGESCVEVVSNLLAMESEDAWLTKARDSLAKGCPITAHLVWEQRQRGRHLGLAEVFRMEFTMALQCCLHADFPEGVRALLIDKDGSPRWQHAHAAAVTGKEVQAFFLLPPNLTEHPLKDL